LNKAGTRSNLTVSNKMPGMRRQLLLVFASAFLGGSNLLAQGPQIPILPDRLAGASATSAASQAALPGDPATWQEAGFIASEARSYSNSSHVEVYRFHDPSGAFVITTALQSYEFMSSHVPIKNAVDVQAPYETVQVGNFIGRFYSTEQNIAPETKAALTALLRRSADSTPLPPIRTYMPDEGRDTLTQRYALGSVAFSRAAKSLGCADAAALVDQAGFSSGAEAMFARYKSGKDEATLLLLEYPTPQLAEVHLKHMERALAAAKSGDSVERKGSLLSIVFAPTSQEYAKKLRSAVNYETQVTWSEPSTTATDPPITSTLVKIIVATGVFMMVTIVVGIAFGGVRIITKRLFPGKVFDRKNQIEVLQLGLSSKPIDPSDMY
jgi:hypothetical protein